MNAAHTGFALALTLLAATPALAQQKGYYGVVESMGGDEIVIRTTENSVGHWHLSPSVAKAPVKPRTNDWVQAQVEQSGVVVSFTIEEHASPRSGVVKEVKGDVLSVRSGNGTENWNIVPTTALHGVERGQVQVGDEIGAQLYKNHNLADLNLIKRGVK